MGDYVRAIELKLAKIEFWITPHDWVIGIGIRWNLDKYMRHVAIQIGPFALIIHPKGRWFREESDD